MADTPTHEGEASVLDGQSVPTPPTTPPAAPLPRLSGALTSVLWALFFSAIIGGWLASGEINIGGQRQSETTGANTPSAADAPRASAPQNDLFRVRVRTTSAQPRPVTLVLRGRTEVEARVSVRAETAGRITKEPQAKGSTVKATALLCQLDAGTRDASVLEARARVAEAEAAFAASRRLRARGFTSELKSMSDRSALDGAKAQLLRAERDLANTTIKAPMGGVIEHRARLGDYLAVGGECARVVRLNPLLITASLAERDSMRVSVGTPVSATLVTGETVEGTLSFVSPTSDPATRTFRIEAKVPNPGNTLRDGVTADVTVRLESEPAHLLAQSTLSLADDGRIGIKAVDDGDRVVFLPVSILGDARDGLWVSGLPEKVRVITVGHEYVVDGQRVEPVQVRKTALSTFDTTRSATLSP